MGFEASRLILSSPGKHRCRYSSAPSHPGSAPENPVAATNAPWFTPELGLLPTHPILPRHTPTILKSLKWSEHFPSYPDPSRSIPFHHDPSRHVPAVPWLSPLFVPTSDRGQSGAWWDPSFTAIKTPPSYSSLHFKTSHQGHHSLCFQSSLNFKTTLPYFPGRMGGLKMQGPLYTDNALCKAI